MSQLLEITENLHSSSDAAYFSTYKVQFYLVNLYPLQWSSDYIK